MPLKSLNLFLKPRKIVIAARNHWLRMRYGIHIGRKVQASLSCRFAVRGRGSIWIGEESLLSFNTLLCSYDPITGQTRKITIGKRCFIGGRSMVLAGVTIGDCVIVGAGSVVASDIPEGSLAVGNPAKVIRSGIEVGPFGRQSFADENSRKYWK